MYSHLFATRYMFERAEEIAELKLESEEQLREWREKRRRGRVQVSLDAEYVDQAHGVVAIDEV